MAGGLTSRVSNGDQVSRAAALAVKRGKSVDFTAGRPDEAKAS